MIMLNAESKSISASLSGELTDKLDFFHFKKQNYEYE